MKNYKTYMDRVSVSDELHHKLLDLESEKKERTPMKTNWKAYTAAAACAALLIGAGVWGVARNDDEAWRKLVATFEPWAAPSAPVPSQSTSEAIDLAPVEPNDVEPGAGMKTIPGYEVRENRAGVDVVVYHVLPYIEYGNVAAASQASLDWDIPQGATRRDLTRDEIVALLGGADAVDTHLDWSGYELTGWAAWYEDGAFWGTYLHGYKGPLDHFEFAVTAGQMPPTCIVFGDSVEQEIWGMTVTADKHDGEHGCSRRVSFMKDNYGYRFDLTATGDPEAAEKLVSRAVTHVAVGGGLNLISVDPEAPYDAPADTGNAASAPPLNPAAGGQDGLEEAVPADTSVPPQDGASAPSVGPQSMEN